MTPESNDPNQPAQAPAPTPNLETTPAPAQEVTPTPAPAPAENPFGAPAPAPTEVPASSTVPPVTSPAPGFPGGQAPKKLSKGLLIGIIAGAILVLAGLGVGAYALLGDKDSDGESSNSVTEAIKNVATGNKEVIDRTDGTLDLSKSDDGKEDIVAQDVSAKLNQQVNLSDGLSLMVTKVERNFTGFNSKYVTVKEGNEVVAVTVVVGSRAEEGTRLRQSALVLSAASDPAIKSTFASSLAKVENAFDANSTIKKGEQVSGVILYQVVKGEKVNAFLYSAPYTNSATDENVTLKVKINL